MHYFAISKSDILEHLVKRNKQLFKHLKQYSCLHNDGLPKGEGLQDTNIEAACQAVQVCEASLDTGNQFEAIDTLTRI